MPVVTTRDFERERANAEAQVRLAAKCIVLKQVNKTMDENEFIDIYHAIDLIICDLRPMAQAIPTIQALKRLKEIGGGCGE